MRIATADFSPDGASLLTGSLDGYLVEWDGVTGEARRVLLDPRGRMDEPAPKVVIKERGIERKAPFVLRRLSECMRGSSICSVRYSHSGRMFAAGAANGSVVLWHVERGTEMSSLTGHTESADALAISPDGRWLAIGSVVDFADSLRVWRLSEQVPVEPTPAFADDSHVGGVSSLCFSPDSKTLVAGGYSMSGYTGAILYGLPEGGKAGWFGFDTTRSLEFSPGGELLVTGDEFGNVKFWDVAGGSRLSQAQGHRSPITAIRFSSDGRYAATGCLDGLLRVWDSGKREEIASTSIEGSILAIRFEDGGVRTAAAADLAIGPAVNCFAFQI